jgi:UDP-N-acetyl-D-galactosamine dehydrogenase
LGYHPQVILSGRRVNDNMGMFVANKVVKLMISNGLIIKGGRVLILGFTFKENCPDVRNTRVVDIHHELTQFGLHVDVYDPWANVEEVAEEYGITIMNELDHSIAYEAIILTVAHDEFKTFEFQKFKKNNGIIFDTKSFIDRSIVDGRL